jgi:NhaC family Na+:H+ antiporter
VLGVPTLTYLPFCFFNLLSPVLDVLFAFIGFKVPTIHPSEPTLPEPANASDGTIDPAPA